MSELTLDAAGMRLFAVVIRAVTKDDKLYQCRTRIAATSSGDAFSAAVARAERVIPGATAVSVVTKRVP